MKPVCWRIGVLLVLVGALALPVGAAQAGPEEGIAWAGDNGDAGFAQATSESDEEPLLAPEERIRLVAGMFQPPAIQPLTAPSELQPFLPPAPGPATGGFGEIGPLPVEVAQRIVLASAAGRTSGQELQVAPPADTGEALSQSAGMQNVDVQRRSQVSFDPHIRGYKWGQVYTQADGAYWFPVRLDLDTMLSKIDPAMIDEVVVIPGPYGLRYGPGFAFIDVVRAPTPRYECFENHFRTSGSVRTNGGQFYGRETVYGGGPHWGYRFSYGERKGSDYEPGDGPRIPSSYHNRDFWGELSYDLTPYQRADFSFKRLDQTDTEYPGQFFDIGHLGTYAFDVSVVDRDPAGPWHELRIDSWYNHTNFRGDTRNKHNVDFPVLQRIDWALDNQPAGTNNRVEGETLGSNYSTGARVAARFGELDETHFRLGADFRYLGQTIREHMARTYIDGSGVPQRQDFDTVMPHAWSADPGMFAEWSSPLSDEWTLSLGARLDYVETQARAADLQPNPFIDPNALEQNNWLYAFYVNNRLRLNEYWTLDGGFGHAQRPPTLVERYADRMFISVAQSGLTRLSGDPTLNPERSWQIDLALSTERETWRGRMSGFYAWVLDYITYGDQTVAVPPFGDARLLQFYNTPDATLAGFELAGEWDWADWLTPFATMSYVEGRDRNLRAPLPSIPPLETRLGLRLHNAGPQRRWEIEGEARIMDNQDRLGTILVQGGQSLAVIEEPTPGFTVWNLRAYWNARENLNLFAGIDNVFDKKYQEHLDLRLLGPAGFPAPPTRVLSPGITPYVGLNWIF